MLATIIIVFLTTLLVGFVGSIVYLISLVVHEDDNNHRPPLGIDSQDFCAPPAISPNDASPFADGQRGRGCETPLHQAIRRQKLQAITNLLCDGADMEARNEHGETPLILACKTGNIFACQLLLIFDANYRAVDNYGQSSRHHTAVACNRSTAPQQTPSSAHLILAMLHEIGAPRCDESMSARSEKEKQSPPRNSRPQKQEDEQKANCDLTEVTNVVSNPVEKKVEPCPDGCSYYGDYNGNSYNRWVEFDRESFYKRHMFHKIIESRVGDTKLSRLLRWTGLLKNERPRARLLSLDGGGLKGVIICQTMIELQKYLKRPLKDYFDWIGGTSVGAFIACMLGQGKSLTDLRKICFDFKDEVFNGERPYDSKSLEQVLKRILGAKSRMSDMKDVKVAVTTTLADRDPCQLRFFRNYRSPNQLLESQGFSLDELNNLSVNSILQPRTRRDGSSGSERSASSAKSTTSTRSSGTHRSSTKASSKQAQSRTPQTEASDETASEDSSATSSAVISEDDPDPLVWQAVRASAAAPFFFQPYGPYLDGGIISNNPTIDLLNEFECFNRVREFLRSRASLPEDEEQKPSKLDVVVSLGTGRGRVVGRQNIIDFGQVAAGFKTVFSPVEMVRSIRAARDLFRRLMIQSCCTEDHILDRAQGWCSSTGVPYFRINPPLATSFSIDDKRDEQLINALWQTKLYMKAMEGQIKELAHILDGTS